MNRKIIESLFLCVLLTMAFRVLKSVLYCELSKMKTKVGD